LPLLRRWLVKLWASRGGGFYGLGYVVTFIALEIQSLSGDLTSVSGLVAQAAQYLIRFSIESFINGVSALIWPVYLFQWLGGLGVVVLAVGYAGFEYAIRPVMEAFLPEIREAIAEKERRKQERKERKARKRA
jgi:DNA integrity scanning protein DisA with diadenylate cyclase activity